MKAINRICGMQLFMVFAFVLAFMNVTQPGIAKDDDKIPDDLSVHGKWNVTYMDKHLGIVSGQARIDEYTSKVTVVFTNTRTKEEFVVNSTKYQRTGKKIIIDFEGMQPFYYRDDGMGYPQQHLIIPESTRKVTVRYGANRATKTLTPRKESDIDKLTLELTILDFNTLSGTWSYQADPFTKRERDGGGRVGNFELLEDGTARQSGKEIWTKPKPYILDTFVLQDQTGYIGGFSDLPKLPYVLPENTSRKKTNSRTLVIFGKNLPQSSRRPAVFTSDSEKITYTGTRYGRDMTNVHDAEVIIAAKEKLLSLYPKLDYAVDILDYVVVRAILKEDILPGDYSFSMNGAEGAWRLKYGDNSATINIARMVRPTSSGANGQDSEATHDVFLPETIHIEVRTNVQLDVEKIDVMMGINGKIWKFGPQGPIIPAYRVPEQPCIYRTKDIVLSKTDFTPLSDTEEIAGKKVPHTVPVSVGDLLTATIAQPGLISLEPQPGRAVVRISPSQKEVNALFKDALVKAVDLVNYKIRRNKRLPAVISTADSIPFVKEIEEIKIEDWGKLPHIKIEKLSKTRLFWWDKLETTIELGDYAAMILLRKTFIDLMRNKINEFKKIKTKKDILAFRHAFEPHVRDLDHVMRWMKVKDSDGKPIFFTDTYRISNRSNSYGSGSDTLPPWIQKATKEAIAQYIEIMEGSLKTVEELSPVDDIKEFVMMTGRSFNAVSKHLKPRLMKLEETKTDNIRKMLWTPDYWARMRIWKVAYLADRIKTHEDLSDTDTRFIYGAAAIVALPVGVWGGTAGYVAGIIIEVADIASSVADSFEKYLESQAEIEFARGTVEVLGYQRLDIAQAEEFDLTRLAVDVGFTVFSEAVGELGGRIFGNMTNFVVPRILNRIQIYRGNKLLAKYDYNIDAVPDGLSDKNYLDMLAFIAHTKRLNAVGHAISDKQAKIVKQLDELESRPRPSVETETTVARPSPETKTEIESTTTIEKTTPELTPHAKAKAEIDDMLPDEIKHLYYRKDILRLVQDAGETVTAALKKNPEKALRILNHTPQITKENFDRAFNSRLYSEPEIKGKDSYDVTAETHEASELLEDNGWMIKYEDNGNYDTIAVKASDGTVDDFFQRGFDPETGTLRMLVAYREHVPAHIDIGLSNAPSAKGWPTFLFAQLRFMKRAGIGFAGQDGSVMQSVYMDSITNARTIAQLAWYMKTRYPGRSIVDLNEEGLLGDFLKDTRSVQYAESVISMAGYRVKKVRLEFYGDRTTFRVIDSFKAGSDGETWEQFLKRYDLTLESKTPPGFDIVIEVEPDPGAIRKMAGGENTPPLSPKTPDPSGSGEFDPLKTKVYPEFEPPSDLPAKVIDARKQADELYRKAKETYEKIVNGEHKLSENPDISEGELARLNDMVRARNIQDGIEASVREARDLGVPEDEIEKILDKNLTLLEVTPRKSREGAYVDLQKAIELQQGHSIVGIKESENLQEMLTHARLGKMTKKDLNLLAEGIAEAKWNGKDYFEELSKTGTFNVHTQQDWRKKLWQSDFELLTNAAGINRLREMARKHGLLGEHEPKVRPEKDFDVAESLDNLRRQNQQDIKNNIQGSSEQLSRLNTLEKRLHALRENEKLMVTKAVESMRRLGVPEFKAMDYASENIRRIVTKNYMPDKPTYATAQLVAEGIIKHGIQHITIKTFVDVLRLNSMADGKEAYDQAAQRLGYAPIPSEIRPGWLYPPIE